MKNDPLRDPKLKLSRAGEHRLALNSNICSYIERKPYRIFDGPNPTDQSPSVFVELTEPLPEKISQICGDVINNLREALDHTTVMLAKKAGRGVANVAFPFGDDKADFETQLSKKIGQLSNDEHQFVRDLEPYAHGKGHELWALDKLWRLNKHRAYPGVEVYNGGVHALVNSPTGPTWFGAGGAGSGYLSDPRLLFHNSKVSDFIEIQVALYPVFSDVMPAPKWLIKQLLNRAFELTDHIISESEKRYFRAP